MKIVPANFRNERLAFERLTPLRKGTARFMMVCTARVTIAGFASVTRKHQLHVVPTDRPSLGEQSQPLHNIAQLSDISRPAILPQFFNRFLIKGFLFPTVLRSNLTGE